jgi:predicted HAD superfamily hydrolase
MGGDGCILNTNDEEFMLKANEESFQSVGCLDKAIIKANFFKPIESQVAECSIVSFDIFDTLLRRPYLYPTHLFDELACQLRQPSFGFRRRVAESMARKKYENQLDVTLVQIYEFLEEDIEYELSLERESLYLRKEVAKFFQFVRSKGKIVVGLSDTYLPSDFIENQLKSEGVIFDELIVSSSQKAAKFDGSAFRHLAQKYKVAFSKILHLGDNPHSDYASPIRFGLKAALLGDHQPRQENSQSVDSLLTKLGSRGSFASSKTGALLRDMRFAHGHGEFWHDLGLYHAGPVLYGFAQWVNDYVSRHDIDKVVFIARDGWLPYLAFQELRPDVSASYAYLSRAVLVKAGLALMSETVIKNLVSGIPAPASDYINRLGDIGQKLAPEAARFFSGDPLITDDYTRRMLSRFFLSKKELLLSYGEGAKNLLHEYLSELGVFAAKNVAFVDVGWSGTGALLLHELFPEADNWNYLYFGTLERFEPKKAKHYSYFFQLGQPELYTNLTLECIEIVEFIFSSSEASAIGLERTPNGVAAVFPEDSAVRQERLKLNKRLETGVLRFFQFVKENPAYLYNKSATCETVYSILENILRTDDLDTIRKLGEIQHQLGLGDSKMETLLSNDGRYWAVIRRWLRGKPIKKKKGAGVSYWPTQEEKFFVASQRGLKGRLARWAYRIKQRRTQRKHCYVG